LGVVLYELITGKKPYQADTPAAVAILQAMEPLAPPSKIVRGVPEAVEKVLYKTLARNPEDRYEDMAAFQDALTGLLQNAAVKGKEKVTEPVPQPQPAPAVVEAVSSEGVTRDALDTTPAEGIQFRERKASKAKKHGLPRWALWVGGVLIGLAFIGMMIGIGGNLVDMGKGGEGPLAMLASETPTETLPPPVLGSTKLNEIDGAGMVYVPAGEFLMGSEDGSSDEAPKHDVYLDAYWIYKHEVTNEQYHACIKAGICSGIFSKYPENKYPADYIDWYEAETYCEWAGGRLPSEAEWEKAARGTDGRSYPWGEESPNCNLANFGGCSGHTVPVGSFPEGASPYGALDMAGNMWEWVADWYDPDYYGSSPSENPTGPVGGEHRVLRGGSWLNTKGYIRASLRLMFSPGITNQNIGFRCVHD
jgi:eukaryotic-like serine/threonine-protein kinase